MPTSNLKFIYLIALNAALTFNTSIIDSVE